MIIQTKSFISTCIFLLIVHFLSAQSYKVTTEIKVVESNGTSLDTLYNAWAGAMHAPQFGWIDINKDGKKDILVYDRMDRKFTPYLNTSHTGQKNYRYTPRFSSVFDTCKCAGWAQIIDYNCDGLEDVICGNVYSNVTVYKQYAIGVDSLGFQLVTNQLFTQYSNFSPLWVALSDIPGLGDIDGDGDMDLLTFGSFVNKVEWHKNKGVEQLGRCDTLLMTAETYCWGHFWEDSYLNTAHLHDTIACLLNGFVPNFKTNTSEPVQTRDAGATILMLDLNGNSLMDLIIGDTSYPDMYAVYNDAGASYHAYIDSVQHDFPSYHNEPISIRFFPATFYGDYNNDGVKDLIAAPNARSFTENYHSVSTYLNQGTTNAPDFHFSGKGFLQDENIELGSNTSPVFFDYNHDSKIDILIGGAGFYNPSDSIFYATLNLMENIGTNDVPVYKIVKDYPNWTNGNIYPNLKQIVPAIVDLDKDGNEDLVLGNTLGTLYYFNNDAPSNAPAHFKFITDKLANIDVGSYSAPAFYDIDNDGDKDLFIGNDKGKFWFYRNNSTPGNLVFSYETNYWGKTKINDASGDTTSKGYAKPFFIDYDYDGQVELLVGDITGNVHIFENPPNNIIDTLDASGLLLNHDVGSYASVAAAVIDSTHKLSYIFGNEKGGLQLYKIPTIPEIDTSVIAIQDRKDYTLSQLYPNPAQENITLSVNNFDTNPIHVSIVNVLGQVINQYVLDRNNNSINIQHLENGIYFFILRKQGLEQTQKICILR